MSKFLAAILNWFKLFNATLLSVLRVILLSKSTKPYRHVKAKKDRIVVLGNGPSFKQTMDENLEFFKSDKNELVALNHFAITNYYTELKPEYYFAIAHDLFLDDTYPEYIDASNKLFKAIVEKTTWKLKFFITYEAKKQKRWQKILSQNENIEIIYMNLTPVEGFKWFRYYCYKRGLGMTRPHNVMIPTIHFAIHSGVRETLLIGSEHSWLKELHVDDNNNALFFNQHFYDSEKVSQKYNHRGTNYLKLHEILLTLATAFESYHELNGYSIFKGQKIYNCTEGSFIDAFERKSISNIK